MSAFLVPPSAALSAPEPAAAMPDYHLLQAPPGFVRFIGGMHLHATRPCLGVRVMAEHLNSIGIAHGGFLATVADTAFGAVMRRQLALPVPPGTVTLNVDYLAGVREGDWLEAHVDLQKAGKQLVNATCLLKVDERLAVRATGIFVMPRA